MENKYFALSAVENNRLVKIIQIVFGIACFAIACFWVLFNINAAKTDKTIWITIIFLAGFGFYMVWAGFGKATRFIEIGTDKIHLKKSILLPPSELEAGKISKIEIYPFSISFHLENKRNILRLSSSYYETNASIKEEVINFAENNAIEHEFIEEEI